MASPKALAGDQLAGALTNAVLNPVGGAGDREVDANAAITARIRAMYI